MSDQWYLVKGTVIGWLSFSTDGGEGREIMVVQVSRLDDCPIQSRLYYQLRWIGNDFTLVKRHDHPTEMSEEVEIGDTVEFSTCWREQDNYAAM